MPSAERIRVYKSKLQQYHQELMWENMKNIVYRNIPSYLSNFDGDESKMRAYLKGLESEFINKARSKQVPLSRILKSKSFHSVKQITRKGNLSLSSVKLTLTQLRTCADRKTKNPRFLDWF